MIPNTFLTKGLERDQWIVPVEIGQRKFEMAWHGNSLMVISPRGDRKLPYSRTGNEWGKELGEHIKERVEVWKKLAKEILAGDLPEVERDVKYEGLDVKLFTKALTVVGRNSSKLVSIYSQGAYLVVRGDDDTIAVIGAAGRHE